MRVETVSIDDLLRGRRLRRMTVRIDADGHEPAILGGIKKTLRRGIDLRFIVAFNAETRQGGRAPQELIAELDRLGLAVFLIDDDHSRFYRLRPNGYWGALVSARGRANLYCVSKSHALSVAFVAHSPELGGAERSLIELVDELVADYGTVCTVVAPRPAGPLVDAITRAGAAILPADLPWWASDSTNEQNLRAGLVRGIGDICRNMLPALENIDPDVIFTQTMVVPWGAFAADVLGKPHAWHICEFGDDYLFSDPFKDILSAIAVGSSFIFTACDGIRTALFAGSDQNRMRTVYRHIPIPSDIKPAMNVYSRLGATRLGLFGKLSEGKGQHEAVTAVGELVKRGHDSELVLAGHVGEPEYHARIQRLVEELGLGERVRIAEFMRDPYPAIAATDIVLVCSRNEAFGRVAAEAMLLGRPVVYARSGGVTEYMEDGVTGLSYTPGNIDELVERIETLIDDPARAAALGAAAQLTARKKFSRDGYGGTVFRILLGLRDVRPEVDMPRRIVKAMLEAISANAGYAQQQAKEIGALSEQLTRTDAALAEEQARSIERGGEIERLSQQLARTDEALAEMQALATKRATEIDALSEQLARRRRRWQSPQPSHLR
jgi:glycosyltransferase involved in cell wall biosynthesis